MKKIFIILSLAFSVLFAEASQRGIPVSIKLVSGATQNAELLQISSDTVFFGGFIADTFTVVKILKNRIESLLDSNGNPLPDSLLENLSQSVPDSATGNLPKTEPQPQTDFTGKALVFPAIRRPIDSLLAIRLQDLEMQTLRELGEHPICVTAQDFPHCHDSPCIIQEAPNAHSIWSLEVLPSKHQDSLDLLLHRFHFASQSQKTEKLTISAKKATTELLSDNRFMHWIQKANGNYQEPEREKSTKNFIQVVTDPEGANLSRKGEEVICQTPCSFATLDTGKIELEAYWEMEHALWANKATIRPIPGDTAKVNLQLKRVQPEVEIRTIPAGAQIFEADDLTPHSRPIGKSPKILTTQTPGPASLHLWKEGFRDSIVQFRVNATSRTVVEVRLDSLQSPQDVENQRVFQQIQKRIFWGKVSLGVSLAPAVAGGILLYLSHKDRDKARDIKDELSLPSSGQGENFQKLVRENHRYADRSKKERYLGTGFLIAAGGLLATCILLTF